MSVELQDLEMRYKNIREQNPKAKKCSVTECKNPRDATPLLGEDTCCAYHRLLFDFWIMDIVDYELHKHYFLNRRARRQAFANWRKKMGKKELDKIVLRLANEGINWEC